MALGAGSLSSTSKESAEQVKPDDHGQIRIHVAGAAGPAPLGAPVETSVPFAPGKLLDFAKWGVFTAEGKAVMAQMRPGLTWPDGSVRWLSVVFEPEAGPGDYVLQPGEQVSGPDLVREENRQLVMESGEAYIRINRSGEGWIEEIGAPGPDGRMKALVKGSGVGDLVLTRHDGRKFRASRADNSRVVVVEERGPVRASVRIEGKCRAEDGEGLFDYIARWRIYRGRAELHLGLTWINATDSESEQLRDIRVTFPLGFNGERLVFGADQGVYDGPFLKDWPVYLLQDDYNWYWAKVHNPDGRIQNLATGGCNGERCPGWLYLQSKSECLGVWAPDFWQEYPNEIEVKAGELSVGLWPERAIKRLLAKPVLPANPFGERRYSATKYWPVMPHPYVAFVDAEKQCLDAVQGLAKTQEIVLNVWGGGSEQPAFETKWWKKSLKPLRGHLDPDYVAATQALGMLWPRDSSRFPVFEALFQGCYDWLNRNIDAMKCYGKFDYGDFKYFTPATDYLCTPGTHWGEMGEMPREGYWQNNERDPFLGLLLYYYRTADPVAWERVELAARHLLDVDVRHHPYRGMWTHSYGHCYVATADAGEPDHSWLWGTLVWLGVSADPVVARCVADCGERLRKLKIDFEQTDARTGSVYLHMMCQFYNVNGDKDYLEAAAAPVSAFLKLQNANGSWPAYMANLRQPRIEGFVEHVIMALADYYSIFKQPEVLKALDNALFYTFGNNGEIKGAIGEAGLAVYGLAVLANQTGNPHYLQMAQNVLKGLYDAQDRNPDSIGRGDVWSTWGVNNPEEAGKTGRPPQFLGQTRPLSPGCILAYSQQVLAPLAADGSHRVSGVAAAGALGVI